MYCEKIPFIPSLISQLAEIFRDPSIEITKEVMKRVLTTNSVNIRLFDGAKLFQTDNGSFSTENFFFRLFAKQQNFGWEFLECFGRIATTIGTLDGEIGVYNWRLLFRRRILLLFATAEKLKLLGSYILDGETIDSLGVPPPTQGNRVFVSKLFPSLFRILFRFTTCVQCTQVVTYS